MRFAVSPSFTQHACNAQGRRFEVVRADLQISAAQKDLSSYSYYSNAQGQAAFMRLTRVICMKAVCPQMKRQIWLNKCFL
jgi:hypothetical protein